MIVRPPGLPVTMNSLPSFDRIAGVMLDSMRLPGGREVRRGPDQAFRRRQARAGVEVAVGAVAWAYAINALSFLAVIAGVLLVRGVQGSAATEASEISWSAAKEGIRFVFSAPMSGRWTPSSAAA